MSATPPRFLTPPSSSPRPHASSSSSPAKRTPSPFSSAISTPTKSFTPSTLTSQPPASRPEGVAPHFGQFYVEDAVLASSVSMTPQTSNPANESAGEKVAAQAAASAGGGATATAANGDRRKQSQPARIAAGSLEVTDSVVEDASFGSDSDVNLVIDMGSPGQVCRTVNEYITSVDLVKIELILPDASTVVGEVPGIVREFAVTL